MLLFDQAELLLTLIDERSRIHGHVANLIIAAGCRGHVLQVAAHHALFGVPEHGAGRELIELVRLVSDLRRALQLLEQLELNFAHRTGVGPVFGREIHLVSAACLRLNQEYGEGACDGQKTIHHSL